MTGDNALRLLGTWLLEARNADEPESRLVRFDASGAMVYTIVVDEREIVMQLSWRIEADDIVTRDSGSGDEVRSRFHFEGDDLVMSLGGEEFRYARVKDVEPFTF